MVRRVQAARFWQIILFKAILQLLAISRAHIHVEGSARFLRNCTDIIPFSARLRPDPLQFNPSKASRYSWE
jgi:hypothetical protein